MFLEEDGDASAAAERTKQSLVDTQARMGMMLDLMPMGLLIHTRQGVIFGNQEAAKLLCIGQANLVGRHFLDFLQSGYDEAEAQIEGAFAGHVGGDAVEAKILSASGEIRVIRLITGALPWDGNAVIQLLLHDITELKEVQEALRRLTVTDELTGAYNRRHAFATAKELLDKKCTTSFAVAILDIDHFKRVNDTFGHASGDIAIKSLSHTVSNILSDRSLGGVTFARIGGEEFLVLFPNMEREGVINACESIREAVEQTPILSTETHFSITVSVGVSFLDGTEPFDCLFSKADAALYEAKRSGRNRLCVGQDLELQKAS